VQLALRQLYVPTLLIFIIYAADVSVDIVPHFDLCAKSQPSAMPEEGADFPKLDPHPGMAGRMAKIKVAYNLVLRRGFQWLHACTCHAPFGSDAQTKNRTVFLYNYVYRLAL